MANKQDLVRVLSYINKHGRIEISKIRFKYNKKQLLGIIEKLKKEGKVFDPYYTYGKEGIFIEAI